MVKGIYVIGNGVDVGANTIFKRLYKFKDTSIGEVAIIERWIARTPEPWKVKFRGCLLYTSDAADE